MTTRERPRIRGGSRPFDRCDALVGGGVWLASQAVYTWTAAPNVSFRDSGELITAAMHLGVPHPPGYPLWTFLNWLFTRLPIGNAAWEVNLFSGACAALAMGLLAALLCSWARWLGFSRGVAMVVAASLSWSAAFSVPIWSQAVVAEVYSLHLLLVLLHIGCLYGWIRNPDSMRGFFGSIFFLALGMTNHHLMLVLTPLPLIALYLLRREAFWETLVYSGLTGSFVYMGFAILSDHPGTWITAIRFHLGWWGALLILGIVRGRLPHWRSLPLLMGTVLLGLLPYLYMPLASSTNPPMNWGNTRERSGFFFVVNRSQYAGSLSAQVNAAIGPLVGTVSRSSSPGEVPQATGRVERLRSFSVVYGRHLIADFTPLSILFVILALFRGFRIFARARAWTALVAAGFLLTGFLQPALAGAPADATSWVAQSAFQGSSYVFFALLAALGALEGMAFLGRRLPSAAPWGLVLLGSLPLFPLVANADRCSQRERWFGWEFGHEILEGLPPGSVLFGGTNAGFFVSTYMIMGESTQPAEVKRDPTFDRRDVYILSQNVLGVRHYLSALHSRYSEDRPVMPPWLAVLGRDSQYPKPALRLPNPEEVRGIIRRVLEESSTRSEEELRKHPTLPNAAIAEWVFLNNRDEHPFFVEESHALTWSYPFAVPHGLIHRLNAEPLEQLPREVVAADMKFWEETLERLSMDARFAKDVTAPRVYSKLRQTTGNLYRFRKRWGEAETAYRQALQLWPTNPEAVFALGDLLRQRGRGEEARQVVHHALMQDPRSDDLKRIESLLRPGPER